MDNKLITKRIVVLLILIITFFSTSVFAKEIDIKIDDVKIVEKSGTVVADDPSFDSENINANVTFTENGDFVTYEVVIKNLDDDNWKIDFIEDNNEFDNLEVEYDFDKDYIEKNGTGKVKVKLIYKDKLINTDSVSIDNLMITLNLINNKGDKSSVAINNPKTGDGILKYLILLIVTVTGLIFAITKKKYNRLKVGNLLILIAILMSPFTIFASEKYQMNININTLLLKSEMLLYEVSFDTDGGGNIETKTLKYGDELGVLPTTLKDGYIFNGWKDQEGNKVTENTVVKGNLELEADYTVIKYDITYDLNKGTAENPTEYTVEDEITLANPTRRGYTFSGWTGSNGDSLQTRVTINKGTTGNKEYVANWSVNTNTKYTVIHRYQNIDGKTYTEETENLEGATDTKVTPQTIDREGFTSPNTEEITISDDGKAKVTYTYIRNKYTLTLEDTDYIETTSSSGEYYYGTEITLKAKDREDYTFIKWSSGETDKEITFNITESTTIWPIYQYNYFIVSYRSTLGNFDDLSNTLNSVKYNRYDKTIKTGTYIKPKSYLYSFQGWYTDESCESGSEFDIKSYNGDDIVVYAKWQTSRANFDARTLYRAFHDSYALDRNGVSKRLKYVVEAVKQSDSVPLWAIGKDWSKNLGKSDTYQYLYGNMGNGESGVYIVPILFWYDALDKTVYWYSEDSSPVLTYTVQYGSQIGFSDFNVLTDISGIKNWDVSKLDQMDSFFKSCFKIQNLNMIKDWDVSNVKSMKQTFKEMSSLNDASAINDWDISKVDDFSEMFNNTPAKPVFTNRSGTFDNNGNYLAN